MKKNLFLFASLAAIILVSGSVAFTPTTQAQNTILDKALQNAKGSLDSLITAKDANQDDLSLRIETFQNILNLSRAEIKDLKIKILSLTINKKDNRLKIWSNSVIEALAKINNSLDDYEALIDDSTKDAVTIDSIKTIGGDFKTWRENFYLPLTEEINDFLLLGQTKDAVTLTEKRWQKIQSDIIKSTRTNGAKWTTVITPLAQKAQNILSEATSSYANAINLFWENYDRRTISSSTITSTTTPFLESSSTLVGTTTVSLATSSLENSSSSLPTFEPVSIRDLIKNSLTKVKETYQVFIEMSTLVRNVLK